MNEVHITGKINEIAVAKQSLNGLKLFIILPWSLSYISTEFQA